MILTKRKLLIILLSLQVVFLGLISLDWMNLKVPLLRQILGFLYLTFIPGLLILRILQVNISDRVDIILHSIGLSLSFLMFIGFVINSILPHFGVLNPISEIPLITTIFIINTFLFIIFYFKDSLTMTNISLITPPNKTKPAFFDVTLLLLFALFPFIAVLGAYFLKDYNNNAIILILYGVISLLPFIVLFKKISDKYYPFIIWIISISLLLPIALINSISLTYQDANVEYYYANLVYINEIWDPSIFGNHNAMLRIVMLHPIHSILLDLSLKEVFRIIHPILYSFTPVALYSAFKKQTNQKIAFLSSYLFMAVFPFYVVFSRNTRTGIAEFFLSLFILTITDKNINGIKKILLLLIYLLSIIVSHYGTAYLLLFSFIIAILSYIYIIKYYIKEYKKYQYCIGINNLINIFILYTVFIFMWYGYNSSSSVFIGLISFLSDNIARLSNLFNPETSYTIYVLHNMVHYNWVFSVQVSLSLILITTIFITIGMISILCNILRKRMIEFRFTPEFIAFSIAFFGILLATFLPSIGFGLERVFHLTLCFLAIYFIIGIYIVFKEILKFDIYKTHMILSMFLMLLFLFNSGFVSETIIKGNDYSPNVLISKPRAFDIKDIQFMLSFYTQSADENFLSGKWLSQLRDKTIKIYTDWTGVGILRGEIHPPGVSKLSPYILVSNNTQIERGYIFLTKFNIVSGIVRIDYPPRMERLIEIYPIITCCKIYTNSGSEIYYQ